MSYLSMICQSVVIFNVLYVGRKGSTYQCRIISTDQYCIITVLYLCMYYDDREAK